MSMTQVMENMCNRLTMSMLAAKPMKVRDQNPRHTEQTNKHILSYKQREMSDDDDEHSLDYQRDPIYIDQDMLRMVART